MTTQEKVTEACYYHNLCDSNFQKTNNFVKVSDATLRKYVKIGNSLDFSLQEKMDQKGKHKLSLTFANTLAYSVKDMDFQCQIYDKMFQDNLTNREKNEKFSEYTECMICCEETCNQIKMPCCSFTCVSCLYNHMETSINDIAFEGCKCPLCNQYLPKNFIYQIFIFFL